MNIVPSVTFSGTPDADDVRAARQAIFIENRNRAALNPPGVALPSSTAAEVKASYLTILTAIITDLHQQNILRGKGRDAVQTRMTPAQLDAINANIIDALNSGTTPDAVVAKTV